MPIFTPVPVFTPSPLYILYIENQTPNSTITFQNIVSDLTLISQACNQKSDYKPIADSDRFLDADFRKNSQKIPSRTIFSQIENFDFRSHQLILL